MCHSLVKKSKASLICVTSLIETDLNTENEKDLIVISSKILTADPKLVLELSGRAFVINVCINVDEV